METLVHFAQAHETFRKPEVEAVAELAGLTIQFTEYSLNVLYIHPIIPLNFRPSYIAFSLIYEIVAICLDNS